MPKFSRKNKTEEKPILNNDDNILVAKSDSNSLSFFSSSTSSQNPKYEKEVKSEHLFSHYKLDEGTGTTATDSGLLGNNGTLVNSPTWTTNTLGQNVLSFDGVNDHISITASNIDGYFHQKSFSVCGWVKYDNSSSDGNDHIFTIHKGGNNRYLHLGWESDEKIRLGFYANDMDTDDNYSSIVNPQSWNHLSFVVDLEHEDLSSNTTNSIRTIYINGVKVKSASVGSAMLNVHGASTCYISRYSDYLAGDLSDIRLYSCALDQDDIMSIYKKTSQKYFDFTQSLSSNLVCHLKLNEGTGTTANDTSSNSYDGTLVNNTTWETGPFGEACAKFDGTDDTITLHTNTYALRDFFHGTSFSISMWVKITASAGSAHYFFSVNESYATRQALHVGRLSNNKITFRFYNDDFDTSSTTITDNEWHHYTFTYNSSGHGRVIYIDGSSDTTNTAGGSLDVDASTHIKLGTNYANGEDFQGSISDFRIYSKVLDAEEVGSIYNNSISKDIQKIKQSGEPALNSKVCSSKIGFCDHHGHMITNTLPVAYENLMLHWELDEGNGYVVFDKSGNGINGYAYVHEGTAQGGADDSITLDANASSSDDIYNEFYVTITGGTGVTGEIRRITDYNGTSKVATVSPNWTTNPSSDTTFNIKVPTESYAEDTGWISSGGPNVGPCFNFDGSKQYITTGNVSTGSGGLNITQGVTVCCWAKSDAENWSGNDCLISKKNGFVLSPTNSEKNIKMIIYDSNEGTPAQSSGNLAPDLINVWHHYTGTYDGNTLRIYLDGGKETTTNTSAGYSIENDSGPLLIGEDDSTDSNRYFDGSICDVRVYNRALNIDEITKIYQEKALYLQQNIYSPNYLENYIASDFLNKYSLAFHLTGQDNSTSGYVYDYSGNLHHGTITATVNYSSTSGNLCVVGSSNSLEFDGDSGFITLDGAQPSTAACNPFKGIGGSSPRTFCCWVKIGGLSANNGILGMGGDGNYEYFNIYLDSDEKINVNTKNANVKFSTALSTSAKQHIAVIYDSINNINTLVTGIRCFINGVEIFIESTTTPYNEVSTNSHTNNVFIGKITDTTNSDAAAYFTGNMDDIRLYNRALSYDEIQLIYNSGDGSYTQLSPYSDTLAIFNMTEGTGTTIYDSSGNNNNITLTGVSWNTSEAKTGLYCLDFDGSNDYGSFPSPGSNQNTITLSTWINLDTIGDNEVIIGSKSSSGSLASGDFQLKLNSITGTNDSKRSLIPHSENNLVGHWKLNDSNGSIMYDSSKYHNHGIMTNDTSLGTHGSIDGISVATFDGTDDTIDLPTSVRDFFHDTSFSISMWVKIASGMFSGAEVMFFSVGTETNNNKNLHIGKRNSNKILFGFYGISFETTDTITDTNWHHYSFTFNSSNYLLTTYLDGSESANYTHNATLDVDDTTHIKIGTKFNNASDLNGSMYDFRIYNRVLTAQEVSDIHASTYYQIDALVTSASTTTITSSKYLSASMWQHLTFVYVNNQYMELYINGECEAKTLLTTDIPLNFNNTLTLGAQDLNGTLSAYLDGKMSDLRIYSKALTHSEIKQIYHGSLECVMRVQPYISKSTIANLSLMDLSTKMSTTNTPQIVSAGLDATSDLAVGPVGRKIVLDGNDESISINSASYIGSTTHKVFSITGWIKPSSSDSGTGNIIFSKYHTSTAANKYYKLIYDDTNSEIDFTLYAGADYTLTSKIIQDEWSHIACICDGSGKQIYLYINGILASQMLIGTISNTNAQTICFGYDGSSNYYLGEICDFQFYETSLSHQAILDTIYNGYSKKINKLIQNTTSEPNLKNGLKVHYTSHAYNSTTLYDISGNGHDGTFVNGAGVDSTGKYGQGLHFDGSDDYINLPADDIKGYFPDGSNSPGDGVTGFSVAVWYKTDDTTSNNRIFVAHGAEDNDKSFTMNIMDTDYYSLSWSQRSVHTAWWNSLFTGHVKADTNWNHMVLTFETTNQYRTIYHNGKELIRGNKEQATDGGSHYTATQNLDLSDMNGSGDTYCRIAYHTSTPMKGYLDDFRLYNRELTSEEVALLYNNSSKTINMLSSINEDTLYFTSSYNMSNTIKPSMPIPEIARDNLVMYYDFTDVSSNTINSTHSKFLPNNLYNNPKLIDVDGINKKIRTTNFSSTKSGSTIVDCGLTDIKKCAQFDGSNDYIASDSHSVGGNWTFDYTGGASEDLWTTSSAHGLQVDDMIMFTTDGGNPSEYNLREIYYVNSVPSTTTCTLSRSMGGSTLAGTADSGSNWAARRLPILFGTDHWTVSLWVKTTSIGSEQYIWSYENNVTLGGNTLSFTASNNTWTCKTMGGSNTAHGLSVGDEVIFNESDESDNPEEYSTNTIYYVNAISGTTDAEESFTLSKTSGGSTLGGSADGSDWRANINYQKSLFIDSESGNEIKFSYDQVEMNTNYKIQPNIWTHITVSKGVYKQQDNIISVYVNGDLCVRKQIIMNNIYNNPRFILGALHGSGLFFTGQIAEVRIYDTYLNEFEIKKLSLNQTQCGPVIHYMCEEGEGTTTKDLGSYGGNLTLSSTTWSSTYKVTGNYSLYFDGTNDYCEANFEGIIGTGTIATCKFTGDNVDYDYETIGHVYSDQSVIFVANEPSNYKMVETNITNILNTTGIETTAIGNSLSTLDQLEIYPTSDYLLYSLWNSGTTNSDDYDIEEASISRRVKPMTISLWFKKYRDTTTGTLVSFGNQTSEVIKLYIDSTSPYKICARLGSGANIINSSFETKTGAASSDSYAHTEWVHVALVILPTREYKQNIQGVRIFVNGEDRTIYTPETTRYTSLVNNEASFKFTLGKDNTTDLSWSYDETGGAAEDLWTADNAHGLAIGDTLMFYTAGTNATNYAANTLYYVVSVPSTTTVTLSDTSGGSAIAGSTDGSGWKSGTNYFKGYMDDIRVYNVALSPNEIKQLYFNTNTYMITTL